MATRRHGSHPHTLVEDKTPLGPVCSICRAALTTTVFRCTLSACGFQLCPKCFDTPEVALPAPQVVVRNPSLDPCASEVVIRTRPRPNSYILAPIYAANLMHVVAYSECGQDGNTYFRLQHGGWVNAQHVVSVLPSSASIAPLAEMHLDFDEDGTANPLPSVVARMNESMDLINQEEVPGYGAVMGYFTLLPAQIGLAGSRDSDTASAFADFAFFMLCYAGQELTTPLLEIPEERLFVRITARAMQILMKYADLGYALQPEVHDVILETMANCAAYIKARLPAEGAWNDDVSKTVWFSVCNDIVYERVMKEQLLGVALSIATSGLQTLTRSQDKRSIKCSALAPVRMLCTVVDERREQLGTTLCQLLVKLDWTRQELLDLDIVELCTHLLRATRTRDANSAACNLLAMLVQRSPRTIQLLHSVVIPNALQLLRTASCPVTVNATLNLCCALSFNTPFVEEERSSDGAAYDDDDAESADELDDTPECTAKQFPGSAPFQSLTVVASAKAGPVALCRHCAARHPPADRSKKEEYAAAPVCQDSAKEPLEYAYFVCQCPLCGPVAPAAGSHSHPPPPVPLTAAQKLLVSSKVSTAMIHRLRVHRQAVANAIGRLSMRLACVTEELALELFGCLIDESFEALTTTYCDAALAVAATKFFPQVQRLVTKYASHPIGRYMVGYAGGLAGAKQVTPHSTTKLFSSPPACSGLTPSPAAHKELLSSAASDGFPAVQLFPAPLQSQK